MKKIRKNVLHFMAIGFFFIFLSQNSGAVSPQDKERSSLKESSFEVESDLADSHVDFHLEEDNKKAHESLNLLLWASGYSTLTIASVSYSIAYLFSYIELNKLYEKSLYSTRGISGKNTPYQLSKRAFKILKKKNLSLEAALRHSLKREPALAVSFLWEVWSFGLLILMR